MELKIVQIGNSAGVVIPKAIRQELGIRVGENVSLNTNGNKIVIVNPKKTTSRLKITPHFLKIIERVNKQYGQALQEIAKR